MMAAESNDIILWSEMDTTQKIANLSKYPEQAYDILDIPDLSPE